MVNKETIILSYKIYYINNKILLLLMLNYQDNLIILHSLNKEDKNKEKNKKKVQPKNLDSESVDSLLHFIKKVDYLKKEVKALIEF